MFFYLQVGIISFKKQKNTEFIFKNDYEISMKKRKISMNTEFRSPLGVVYWQQKSDGIFWNLILDSNRPLSPNIFRKKKLVNINK